MSILDLTGATKLWAFSLCLMFTFSAVTIVGEVSAPNSEDYAVHPLHVSLYPSSSFSSSPYTPAQIKTAYNLPADGGAGATIAIVNAYHAPNILENFDTFSHQYGLPDNDTGNLIVYSFTSETNSGWALETALDVEWAHAIAPQAKILLVEAAGNMTSDLLTALDYATSYPGVVAVSMSWGTPEFQEETLPFFENHFNKPGITFFAASGDDGENLLWPAASSNVVSVGGTTLHLNTDGTVISETAWTNSTGGISQYFSRPSYQTDYGLTYSHRAVPDVSYNGNLSTGVSVYDGTWYKVGGTSAGAPQWAAIHALGLSTTNANLYGRAKTAYPAYFRDIIQGQNWAGNPATVNYDLVTGLGSPLTMNFDTYVTVSPASGGIGSTITVSGTAFLGSTVDISYYNPATTTWVTAATGYPTTASAFTFTMDAPDLEMANPAGDNAQIADDLIFRVKDNANGHTYNGSTPFTMVRRGLTQVGEEMALGVFGNNTDFAKTVFVGDGTVVQVAGSGFRGGTASLLWDGVATGSADVGTDGVFSGSLTVPPSTAGQHTLTINNASVNFAVTLTRLPAITTNYTGDWQTADLTVTLTPDTPLDGVNYQVNGGTKLDLAVDGHPRIGTEGANTLEYSANWSSPGTGDVIINYPTLTVKIDKTAPTGAVTTATTTDSQTITLNLNAADATSGVSEMRFSNDGTTWSTWENYAATTSWTLGGGDGAKTVSAQYRDNAGLVSQVYTCQVTLQTPVSTPTPQATSNPTQPSSTSTPQPSTSPAVPELNASLALFAVLASTALLAVYLKKQGKRHATLF